MVSVLHLICHLFMDKPSKKQQFFLLLFTGESVGWRCKHRGSTPWPLAAVRKSPGVIGEPTFSSFLILTVHGLWNTGYPRAKAPAKVCQLGQKITGAYSVRQKVEKGLKPASNLIFYHFNCAECVLDHTLAFSAFLENDISILFG